MAQEMNDKIETLDSPIFGYGHIAKRIGSIKKALVPVVVGALTVVAQAVGLEIPPDQLEVIALSLITAVSVYVTTNKVSEKFIENARKALVPIVIAILGLVAPKLGLELSTDQVEVIAGEVVIAVLVYVTRND